MDLNIVVLCGRIAVAPEHRVLDSGSSLLRLLITIRSETPHRRVDVIPIVVWNPPDELLDGRLRTGARVWATGVIQRRFPEESGSNRSKVEVIAYDVQVRQPEQPRSEARRLMGDRGMAI